MTCKWKVFCKQGETCVAHNGYDIWRCTAFKDKGVPMTNEEWFCGLSTEEKAEWLSKHFHCGDCILEKPMCGGEYDGCKSAFVEWLKEIHKDA